jgi:hypothetical protein
MRVAAQEEAFSISFPDFPITSFLASTSIVQFRVLGSHVDKPKARQTGPVIVRVEKWRNARVFKYNSDGTNPVSVDITMAEQLMEIAECRIDSESAIFSGFTTISGVWESIEFRNPLIEIVFEDE